MDITIRDLVVWVVIGALAGSFAGMLVKRSRQGFGRLTNLGVGLAGALIGGAIFRLFNIDLGWGDISVSLEDLVAAFAGSILLLIVLAMIRRTKAAEKGAAKP